MAESLGPPSLLKLAEVASILGVTVSGVRSLISRGQLVAVRISERRGVRVRPADLQAYIQSLPTYSGPSSWKNRGKGSDHE